MKKVFLLLLLAACASKSVQLTPEETKNFLAQYPSHLEALKMVQDPEIRSYRHQYVRCQEGQCFLYDCRGTYENPKCWKTPMDKEEIEKMHSDSLKARSQNRDRSPSDFRESCMGKTKSLDERRMDCVSYLRLGINHSNSEVYQEVIDHLCQMPNAECKKNGKPYGNGRIRLGSGRVGTESIEVPNGQAVDTYLLVFGTND